MLTSPPLAPTWASPPRLAFPPKVASPRLTVFRFLAIFLAGFFLRHCRLPSSLTRQSLPPATAGAGEPAKADRPIPAAAPRAGKHLQHGPSPGWRGGSCIGREECVVRYCTDRRCGWPKPSTTIRRAGLSAVSSDAGRAPDRRGARRRSSRAQCARHRRADARATERSTRRVHAKAGRRTPHGQAH